MEIWQTFGRQTSAPTPINFTPPGINVPIQIRTSSQAGARVLPADPLVWGGCPEISLARDSCWRRGAGMCWRLWEWATSSDQCLIESLRPPRNPPLPPPHWLPCGPGPVRLLGAPETLAKHSLAHWGAERNLQGMGHTCCSYGAFTGGPSEPWGAGG